MTTHANPRYGPPKIPTRAGFPMSRSSFLRGDLRAYYGPGQRPDAGEPGLYVPPLDWNPAGSLLRPPQQVWLYLSRPVCSLSTSHRIDPVAIGPFRVGFSRFFDQDPHIWFMNYYSDGRVAALAYVSADTDTTGPFTNTLGSWQRIASLDPPGHHAYYLTVGPFDIATTFTSSGIIGPTFGQTIGDPYLAEYNRLLPIFNMAKARVEFLRPGRTWVGVIDPWDYANPNQSIRVPPAYFGATSGDFLVGTPPDKFFPDQPMEYWPMLSPADAGPYFGTDFLMVYCGSPDTTEIRINDASPGDGARFIAAARPNSLSGIAASSARFRGYGIRYFDEDVAMPQFPHYAGASSLPPGFDIQVPSGTGAPGSTFDLHVFPTLDRANAGQGDYVAVGYWTPGTNSDTSDSGMSQAAADIAAGINGYIDSVNLANSTAQTANRDQHIADAADLAVLAVDGRHLGGSSLIADFNDLVRLIAAYYGFDPDTGADL